MLYITNKPSKPLLTHIPCHINFAITIFIGSIKQTGMYPIPYHFFIDGTLMQNFESFLLGQMFDVCQGAL